MHCTSVHRPAPVLKASQRSSRRSKLSFCKSVVVTHAVASDVDANASASNTVRCCFRSMPTSRSTDTISSFACRKHHLSVRKRTYEVHISLFICVQVDESIGCCTTPPLKGLHRQSAVRHVHTCPGQPVQQLHQHIRSRIPSIGLRLTLL